MPNNEKIIPYQVWNLANGDVTELHYIAGGGGLTAIHVVTTPNNQQPTTNNYYTYTDHLGSILTLTDANANIVYETNFDAWGRRRNADDWTYYNTQPFVEVGHESISTWLTRGYTGHEHLATNGLINMNGRMYDPILGRMLSPDNYVQSPFNTQSYNRYSYVINNPLKYIDPSGENWWTDFWDGVGDAWNGFWDFLNGTYNPATGQLEGGLAQQVPSWVPNFSVGVNSSGQTFHSLGNSESIYHNYNTTIPGINWSEVNAVQYASVGGMPTTGLYGEPLDLGGFQPSLDEQSLGDDWFIDISNPNKYPGISIYETDRISGGATLPGIGIFVDDRNDIRLIQHEYGHYLNYKYWENNYGKFIAGVAYYKLVAEPSSFNMGFDRLFGTHTHTNFYPESWADQFAKAYFRNNYQTNKRFSTYGK